MIPNLAALEHVEQRGIFGLFAGFNDWEGFKTTEAQLLNLRFELGNALYYGWDSGELFIDVLKLPEGWTYQFIDKVPGEKVWEFYNEEHKCIVQDAKGHLRVCSYYNNNAFLATEGGYPAEVCPRFRSEFPGMLMKLLVSRDDYSTVYPSRAEAQIFDGELITSSKQQLIAPIPGAELIVPDGEFTPEFYKETRDFAARVLDKYLPQHKDPFAYWGEDCSAAVANIVKAFADYRQNVFLPGVTRLIAAKPAHDPKP